MLVCLLTWLIFTSTGNKKWRKVNQIMPDKIFPTVSVAHLANFVSGELDVKLFYEDEKIKMLAEELANVFIEWGFVYLIDHGIGQKVIEDANRTAKDFFMSSKSKKEQFLRNNDGENWGYVPFNVETFEKSRPFDLKECFNFLPDTAMSKLMDKEYPEFMTAQKTFFRACKEFSLFMLRLFNLSLPTEDREFLVSKHQYMDSVSKNATISRILHYPPIENSATVLKDQLRCGEHSDYGTFTLLFQDEVGGLQVVNPDGEYVDATPVPDSIVVNVGDMLEIWSAGKFKSTRHRVIVPDGDTSKARQSTTLFIHPDNDITVSCLDGSDKYEPVNPFEYLMQKFDATYG